MLTPNVNLEGKTILVTGAAGFIGSNLVMELLRTVDNVTIVGLDNMNDYYDVSIKEYRLQEIDKLAATKPDSKWIFVKGNLADKALIEQLFTDYGFAVAVNLAAQAGVRYSITNPDVYIESNLIGFYNILEACRNHPVEHLVYASSSSVYGSNKKVPYSTEDKVDNPVSLYAATKKSNELMAHAYSKLYNIPSTGLRFFTVYGPAGRPDMAYFGFTNKLIKGENIQIFNYGNCQRDFTYVDDIVEGVKRVMQNAPGKKDGEDGLPLPPYRVYNIGNSNPENLLDFVDILQKELISAGVLPEDYDFEAHKQLVPMQPGDVPVTFADTSALEEDLGFKPNTSLRSGLRAFAEWYKKFYLTKE
ncbi:MAG: NAD-dependent epimerase/dehydratase family protein [Clostridiales bacterium]|nr:NAD-dependent epimerase/dehydratase family protein [Clostridiales bacterium]